MAAEARRPLFDRLEASLEASIAHAKGEVTLKSAVVVNEAPDIDATNLIALRKSLGLSQAVFAMVLNVSTKTVQAWEQGQREPSQAALRLIEVIAKKPGAFGEVVGMPELMIADVEDVEVKREGGKGRLVVPAGQAKGSATTTRSRNRKPKMVVEPKRTARKREAADA